MIEIRRCSKFRRMILLAVALSCISSGFGCSKKEEIHRISGAYQTVGTGLISSFAEFDRNDKPLVIGIVFNEQALDQLPAEMSDGHQCFDRNGDGTIDPHTECNAWHEWIIPLPSDVARRTDIPFKWAQVNWNPKGHIPPGVYDKPHFDVHFFLEGISETFGIQSGPCGPEFVRCDQFKLATKAVPPNYIHPDYKSVDAVAPAMGNHLIDFTSPEFHGQNFMRTMIYGSYDGKITFYEEMLTLDYLRSQTNKCNPIKSSRGVAIGGYYPSGSCVRHDPAKKEYSVSLEKFTLRKSSPPEPVPTAPS
jgi:hypothetical protein